MNFEKAATLAHELTEAMVPYCERVAVAGSVRREKPECRDIEIVAIPRWRQEATPGDLFGAGTVEVNALHEWATVFEHGGLIQWIKPGTSDIVPWAPKPNGRYWRGLMDYHGQAIKLDLFLCRPENWGAIYLIRTGSAEFSHAVAGHAQRIGRAFDKGSLTMSGLAVETPEEADVFRLLSLEYVEPRARTDGSALKRL